MEAIILAGGRGTRLQECIKGIPKPMAPINDIPFLEILLSRIVFYGFTRIYISVGYLADVIIDYFGDSFKDIPLVYVNETSPLGTGGAIKRCLDCINGNSAFVFNGDSFSDVDPTFFTEFSSKPSIVLKESIDSSRFGSVLVGNNEILGFTEKAASDSGLLSLINLGIYFLPKHIFADFNMSPPFSFEIDFLPYIVHKIKFKPFIHRGLFIDIGTPLSYLDSQFLLKSYTG